MPELLNLGRPVEGSAGLVRARPTHRDLEAFALSRLPGITRSKAKRLARLAVQEADPYTAVLGRSIEARMLRGADPTGDTALRNATRRGWSRDNACELA